MGILGILAGLLMVVCGVGSLVCFILVLVQMFKRGETTLGAVCIVLAFCTGIGSLIAFVYGWMKSTEWDLKNIMLAWTGCFVGYFLGLIIWFAVVGVAASNIEQGPPPGFDPGQFEEMNIEFE